MNLIMNYNLEPTVENTRLVREALASFINTKTTEQLIDILIELSCSNNNYECKCLNNYSAEVAPR